jgi:hypothetical protein
VFAVLLDLSQYFVTGPDYARMWSPFMHHRAILAPFLILGVMDVFEWMRNRHWPVDMLVCVLVCSSIFQQYYFHFALNKLTKSEYWKQEPWMDNLNQLIANTPITARLAAQQNLVPHVSHRNEIYLVYPRKHDFLDMPCGEVSCWWLDFDKKAEYLLVDTRPDQWLTQILETNENYKSAITTMEKKGVIHEVQSVGDAKLYRVSM